MNEPSDRCHRVRAMVVTVLRSTLTALERIPPDARKRGWRVLEDATRVLPRALVTAPMGGRLPVVRPTVTTERLAAAVRGKRILITGATSGIGLEAAYAVSRAGDHAHRGARDEDHQAARAHADDRAHLRLRARPRAVDPRGGPPRPRGARRPSALRVDAARSRRRAALPPVAVGRRDAVQLRL